MSVFPMPNPVRKRGDRGKSSLKQSHVARVVKGVAAAGIENARFEVDPHSGKITVFVGEMPVSTAATNSWNEVYAANKERAS
jgi:hypothetical protein